jgi:predicted AAA+ superfamily ATPase
VDGNRRCNFIIGDDLTKLIKSQTGDGNFRQRNFVKPLVEFCTDGDYTARIGIVYGLRSTGKTVGMLHAAEELIKRGHKVAYARFNYEETGMRDVNAELSRLTQEGYTHFFLDEASYLGGFLNASAEWADTFVPIHRVKIVISGTDSFLLWLAQGTSLFHRYVPFATNWISYPEYKRVRGDSFDEYKTGGGIFTNESIPNYIRTALVENLLHSLEHYFDDANRTNEYTSRLLGIDEAVIYKTIVSVLKCAVETDVKRHFIKNADKKIIADLGTAISEWSAPEKRDIKERVADSLDIYKDFVGIKHPERVIEALVEFLVKIECLAESRTGISDYGEAVKSYSFAHNALMNYAAEETIHGIFKLKSINHSDFAIGIKQAIEGALNESIVFAHTLKAAGKDDKVLKYRDLSEREVDIVVINRETKTVRLVEVKSKPKLSGNVWQNEAKHLFSHEILINIAVDDSYIITRVLVFGGKSCYTIDKEKTLLCVNIADYLAHYSDIAKFLGHMSAQAEKTREIEFPKTLVEQICEDAKRIHEEYVPPQKKKGRNNRDIGD